MPTQEEVRQALRQVLDPEIGKPIEDVGMLKGIEVDDGVVRVYVLLTIAGCPLKDRIDTDVRGAVGPILDAGQRVEVILGEMNEDQRKDLVTKLQESGYPVARRTVTKYRKMLRIPSSRQRKDWTLAELHTEQASALHENNGAHEQDSAPEEVENETDEIIQ